MMNLAVIDTKTHEVKVFNGKNVAATVTFGRALDTEETESFRKDPQGFVDALNPAKQEQEESAQLCLF